MYTSDEKRYRQTSRSNNTQKRQSSPGLSSRQNVKDTKSSFFQMSRSSTFQIPAKNILPVVTKIKQQNEFFQSQREKLQHQMKQLYSLSQMLVSQNQALRQHYKQRSIDLQQIIGTFIVNTKQDMSDLNHLIFACRQHNEKLNKKLAELAQQNQMSQNRINQLKQNQNKVKLKNIHSQNNIRARQIKNQQNNKILKKPKQVPKYAWTLEGLQKQVCDLYVKFSELKRNNLQLVQQIKKQQYKIQYQEPLLKQKTIQTIRQNKPLQTSIQQKKVDVQIQQQRLNSLNSRNQELLTKIYQIQSSNQSKRMKIGLMTDKIRNIQKQICQTKQQNLKQQIKKQQKIKIKQNLQSELQKQQKAIQLNRNNYEGKKVEIEKQAQANIDKIRLQIQQNKKIVNPQIVSHVFLTKKQNSKVISDLKYQLNFLQKHLSELQKTIQTSSRNNMKVFIPIQMPIRKTSK